MCIIYVLRGVASTLIKMMCNKTVKINGGHRTKGAKDKQKRCTRGYRRSTITGICEPARNNHIHRPDNTLFSNELIRELSKIPDVKRVLNSKNIMFQTRSQFIATKMFKNYEGKENKLISKIGAMCDYVVSDNYYEKALDEAIYDYNPYVDILFIKNKKQKVLGFLTAELGSCAMHPNTYAINLICSESGMGKLLVGACLFCIKYNDDVPTKACILELAHSYKNIPGFFMYTKMGFNVDNSLIGGPNSRCFHDAIQLPMSVKLTDKYTKQYIADAMVRPDFKQTDVNDPTGIYVLGMPRNESEDKGKSLNIQERMMLIACVIRKFKVYSKNEKYKSPTVELLLDDEWKYVKNMEFVKTQKIPTESQSAFRKYLHKNKSVEHDFLDALNKEFLTEKKEFAESKQVFKIKKEKV